METRPKYDAREECQTAQLHDGSLENVASLKEMI